MAVDDVPGWEDSLPSDPDELVLRWLDRIPHRAIDRAGPDAVVAAAVRMLRDPSRANDRACAITFIRDSVRRPDGHEGVRGAVRRSELLPLLRDALTGEDDVLRGLAADFLSSPGGAREGRHLIAAWQWAMEHDPLLLPRLQRGIAFKSGAVRVRRTERPRLTAAATHRRTTTRWIAVSLLPDRGWARQLLRQLAQDRHPGVRTDARATLAGHRLTTWHPWMLRIEEIANAAAIARERIGVDLTDAVVDALDAYTAAHPGVGSWSNDEWEAYYRAAVGGVVSQGQI